MNFKEVETTGIEASIVADVLAGLRASEARYFWNKYKQEYVVYTPYSNKWKENFKKIILDPERTERVRYNLLEEKKQNEEKREQNKGRGFSR